MIWKHLENMRCFCFTQDKNRFGSRRASQISEQQFLKCNASFYIACKNSCKTNQWPNQLTVLVWHNQFQRRRINSSYKSTQSNDLVNLNEFFFGVCFLPNNTDLMKVWRHSLLTISDNHNHKHCFSCKKKRKKTHIHRCVILPMRYMILYPFCESTILLTQKLNCHSEKINHPI